MESRKKFRAIILPVLAIVFAFSAYERLNTNVTVPAIQQVSLIAIGMAIGVLIRNLVLYFRGKM